MEISFLQAFSIVDGRLATDMTDVKKVLDYIFDMDLPTVGLLASRCALINNKPEWFINFEERLDTIRDITGSDNFKTLMNYIDVVHPDTTITITKL